VLAACNGPEFLASGLAVMEGSSRTTTSWLGKPKRTLRCSPPVLLDDDHPSPEGSCSGSVQLDGEAVVLRSPHPDLVFLALPTAFVGVQW